MDECPNFKERSRERNSKRTIETESFHEKDEAN